MMSQGLIGVNESEKVLSWQVGGYIYAQAHLPRGARVLDVGGGSDPHPGADVVIDRYLDDNSHRPGQADLIRENPFTIEYADGRKQEEWRTIPLVQGDMLALPFPDKSFDFVIAKDVLEHVEDVEQACAELGRVGKTGVIDAPRLTSEYLFPQGPIHSWVFEREPEGIVARSVKGFISPWGNLMHTALAQSPEIQSAWAKSRFHFHTIYFWRDAPRCRIGPPVRVDE